MGAMVPVIALGYLTLISIIYIIYALKFSPYHYIPGPAICKLTRLWTIILDLRLKRNERINEWHQKYGPVVLIAPGQVSVSSPGATKHIYGTAGHCPKSSYFNNFTMYGERPTFTALQYEEHQKFRRLSFGYFQASSIYHESIIGPIRERMHAYIGVLEKDLKASKTVEFFTKNSFYAFDNISRLVFGPEKCTRAVDEQSKDRRMVDGLKDCQVFNSIRFHLPLLFIVVRAVLGYTMGKKNFLKSEDTLADWTMGSMQKTPPTSTFSSENSLENGERPLVHHLRDVKTKSGESLSHKWIAAESFDNLNAGQATVTVALTYAFWNLARNSDWQTRLREEIRAMPKQSDGLPSFADLNAGPILEACVRESLRINPISSGKAERILPVEKELDGVVLPRGTTVSTSTIAIHHSPSVFDNPSAFDPSRWLSSSPEHLKAMEACYMPFGYGARLCLGKTFALVEIKTLVAGLVSKYHVSPDLASTTTFASMRQTSTQDALPKGLKCELVVEEVA